MSTRLAQIQNLTLAQLLEETSNEEITAITGDVLTITSQHDPDDWWTCSLGDLLTFLATATKEAEIDGEHVTIIEESVKDVIDDVAHTCETCNHDPCGCGL